MGSTGQSRVAFLAAGVIGALLVVVELLVRETSVGDRVRAPSGLVSEVLASTTSVELSGWPALIVPVLIVLLLGLVIDAASGMRR